MLESCIKPIIYIFILTLVQELTTSSSTWKNPPCSWVMPPGPVNLIKMTFLCPAVVSSMRQLEGYLACSTDHMDLLKSFPALCKLSVKLNTSLLASAVCERLFSIAGLVLSPRRAPTTFKDEQQIFQFQAITGLLLWRGNRGRREVKTGFLFFKFC